MSAPLAAQQPTRIGRRHCIELAGENGQLSVDPCRGRALRFELLREARNFLTELRDLLDGRFVTVERYEIGLMA